MLHYLANSLVKTLWLYSLTLIARKFPFGADLFSYSFLGVLLLSVRSA